MQMMINKGYMEEVDEDHDHAKGKIGTSLIMASIIRRKENSE